LGEALTVGAPEPLTDRHHCTEFMCGREMLDTWLKQRALRNQVNGASRTFVVCDAQRVVAFYALASSAVASELATGRLRRNMPDPIPVVVLARLAVDRSHQGLGLGRALMQDAGRRVLGAADAIGIRGLLVHALDESAKAFYHRLGFDPSPLHPMTLMITLGDLRASLMDPTPPA
jgi:GNAT superfamily N-acetyltransferase